MADRLYEVSEKLYRDKQTSYRGIAKNYGLDGSMLDLGGTPQPKTETVDEAIERLSRPVGDE